MRMGDRLVFYDVIQKIKKKEPTVVAKEVPGAVGIKQVPFKQTMPIQSKLSNKNIFVIGETGTGKSSLINSMVNFLYPVQFASPYRWTLIAEESDNQSHSQTKDINEYFIKVENPRIPQFAETLTIIDTPGFADTSGFTNDLKILEKIENFLLDDCSHLDGICFVMKQSQRRLTANQKYILGRVFGLFGKDFKFNIFAFVTFADGSKVNKDALQSIHLDCRDFFPINNEVFKFRKLEKQQPWVCIECAFSNYYAMRICEECKAAKPKRDAIDIQRNEQWESGMSEFSRFFCSLMETPRIPLFGQTRSLIEVGRSIEYKTRELIELRKEGLTHVHELKTLHDAIERKTVCIANDEDFKVQLADKVDDVDISGQGIHTVTCTNCLWTCSESVDTTDSQIIAMRKLSDFCQQCPGRCALVGDHQDISRRYVRTPQFKVDEDKKKRYLASLKEHAELEEQDKAPENAMHLIHRKSMGMINDIKKQKKQILRKSLFSEMVDYSEYFDQCIQTEQQEKNDNWERNKESLNMHKQIHCLILNIEQYVQNEQKLWNGQYPKKASSQNID
jgi:GTP-binding protein EngB required for normal cell division